MRSLAATAVVFGVLTTLPAAVAGSSPPTVALQPAWSTGANRGLLSIDASITTAAFGADGSELATAGPDGIVVWDVASATVTGTLDDSAGDWVTVTLGDGEVVAQSADGDIARWSTTTGELLDALATVDLIGDLEVAHSALSPDGTVLAAVAYESGARDAGPVRLWDVATGSSLDVVLEGTDELSVTGLLVGPAGDAVVVFADDSSRVFDGATGAERFMVEGADRVGWAAFGPGGAVVATSGHSTPPTLWDAGTGELLAELGATDGATAVFSSDGTYAATSDGDVYETSTGRAVGELEFVGGAVPVAFSPSGGLIAGLGGQRGTVVLWEQVTGLPVATPDGHTAAVRSVSFAADGATVLTGAADGTARTWDAATGGPLTTFAGHDGGVFAAELSADGTTVATVGQGDDTVRLWGAQTGATAAVLTFDDAAPLAATFTPDGRTLVTLDTDGAVQLVDVSTGEVRRRIDAAGSAIALSADGTRVAAATAYDTAAVWDTANGDVVTELPAVGSSLYGFAFDPSGERLAGVSTDDTLHVWDVTTGATVATVGVDRGAAPLAFGADGSVLFGAGVWDVATGSALVRFAGGSASAGALSPEGALVAAVYDDGTLALFDVASGEQLDAVAASSDELRAVAFSPDGSLVVAGGEDGVARAWNVEPVN